jgi:UDP:flavonoid glycosyltransferase YjiC (YdhE family)
LQRIAYYISSHGFGHAARQQAIIRELAKQGAEIHVRSASPAKFFTAASSYHQQRYDIGMIQADALHFDIPASLNWMADFLKEQPKRIASETAFIREKGIELIVSDMPPIAFEIAEAAQLPSVAITHFTWDWVY